MILGIVSGSPAGSGGGTAHRYWRVKNFTGSTTFFETSEIQLLEGVTVRSAGVTPTASDAPGAGSLAFLTNGALNSNQVYWTTAVADTLVLTFDLGAAFAIDGYKHSRYDTAGRFATSVTLEWSDDNSAWTTVGTSSVTQPGTDYTLSTLVTF